MFFSSWSAYAVWIIVGTSRLRPGRYRLVWKGYPLAVGIPRAVEKQDRLRFRPHTESGLVSCCGVWVLEA